MRSRRVHVGGCDTGRTDIVSVLDQPEHVLNTADFFLLQSYDLHLLFGILKNAQFLLVVE